MLEKAIAEVYEKLKLNFYRNIFNGFATRESSLTASQTFFTEVVHALNEPTIKEVAEFLNVTQPNVSYKANNLEKVGYICRVPSQEDKREMRLEVTEKFYRYYDVRNEYLYLVIERAKARFSDEELAQFEHMLTVISEELMPEINAIIDKGRMRV